MTAIWQHDGAGWRLLAPSGFPDEAALHGLVEHAPHTLPLAGDPRLTVLGREVPLGGNAADLIAVERSGRLAIIEIKLARNAEARRAVIAQILTYAAYLRGLDVATLEREVLGRALRDRGVASVAAAVQADDQGRPFDAAAFEDELADGLAQGRFRLVLVLDDAPAELVRLVGYLEAVADKLLIDLVTVAAYEIAGSRVIVPQRVDPEQRAQRPAAPTVRRTTEGGWAAAGADDFAAAIDEAPEDQRPLLCRLTEWAQALEREGLVQLTTFHGKSGRLTLLPRLREGNVGLVTVYNDRGPNGAYLQFNRTVIERRAPLSVELIERLAAPAKVGAGTVTRMVSDELLSALTAAYRDAATGRLHIDLIDPTSTH